MPLEEDNVAYIADDRDELSAMEGSTDTPTFRLLDQMARRKLRNGCNDKVFNAGFDETSSKKLHFEPSSRNLKQGLRNLETIGNNRDVHGTNTADQELKQAF
ncbi:hypothetical protein RUND412_003824 [Rhizina undulata]